MARIRPKNWTEFQHYKDRAPDWIKLHRSLLDDYEFHMLPLAARALAPMLWLIASDSVDGSIDANEKKIAFRTHMDLAEIHTGLEALLEAGFFEEVDEDLEPVPATAKSKRDAAGFSSRHISDETKRAVWERDNGQCRNCASAETIEYDHVVPVSKGGSAEADNIQLLCRPCNRSKRAKTAERVATTAERVATPDLNSRSLEKENKRQVTSKTQEKAEKKDTSADADCDLAFQAFNSVAREFNWPVAETLSPERRKKLRARLSECGGIEGWRAAMAKARASPFLRGETVRDKAHENWMPYLDFFLKRTNFTKLMEGGYGQRGRVSKPSGFSAVLAGASASIAGSEGRSDMGDNTGGGKALAAS